ncbi:DUF4738 domain-containing protein [Prevotella ihumii]|uniref:DUF4738 domain-containing protein n=1 Tax=Prevotella ihumii TaxID=1917878 RepID=UPI00098094DB|nr:DUF4738 domain-containing protein [Prevotella ihumii]
MKQKIRPILLIFLFCLGITSCKKEKKTDTIITKITPKPKISNKPQQQTDFKYHKVVEWIGNKYTIFIERRADKSLPMVKDADGRKYYDNKMYLKIVRADGSEFFARTFTKDDFRAYTNNDYGRNGALIGFMFDKVEGNALRFGASVGSPDPNSDEFIPIDVVINNFGHFSVSTPEALDTIDDNQPKPKKDMIESAEEDGM